MKLYIFSFLKLYSSLLLCHAYDSNLTLSISVADLSHQWFNISSGYIAERI